MAKFKVKNRKKRKYVRKRDVSHSFSPTQTLSLGAVPLAVIAVAFFATILISSQPTAPDIRFSVPTFYLPQLALPQFTLPAAPAIPAAPAPSVPEIEIPYVSPDIAGTLTHILTIFDSVVDRLLFGAQYAAAIMGQLFVSIVTFLDPRPMFSAAGHITATGAQQAGSGISTLFTQSGVFLQTLFQQIGSGITSLFSAITYTVALTVAFVVNGAVATVDALRTLLTVIAQALIQLATAVQQFVVQTWIATIQLIQNIFTAVSHAISAFVYWLGTPFRAVGETVAEINFILDPFYQFIGNAFQHAIDDFNAGANSLQYGTEALSNQVSSQ